MKDGLFTRRPLPLSEATMTQLERIRAIYDAIRDTESAVLEGAAMNAMQHELFAQGFSVRERDGRILVEQWITEQRVIEEAA